MRKPLLVLLTALIFCLFVVLGFLTASNEHGSPPLELSITGQSATAYQQNLLILQVDNLDKSPPLLQSAWVAGIFNSPNQTVVTFSRLFPPEAGNSDFKGLANDFRPDEGGYPNKLFLTGLKKHGISWQGYVLADNNSSMLFDQWLREQGSPIFTPAPASAAILFDAVCRWINTQAADPATSTDTFDWSNFAQHIKSDVPASDLQSTWNTLFSSSSSRPTRCEMVTQ